MVLLRKKNFILRIIFLIFAYLPVLTGGGECVALCLGADGAVSMNYEHHCGRERHPESTLPSSPTASFTDGHHHGSCTDIPLASGNQIHSAPETGPAITGYASWAMMTSVVLPEYSCLPSDTARYYGNQQRYSIVPPLNPRSFSSVLII